MKNLDTKLNSLRNEWENRNARIMIIGLGSVGNYLLDYLISTYDENMEICVVGRSMEKMLSDVNIVKISSLIRGQNKANIQIIDNVDLNEVNEISDAIYNFKPDIIVNSSRAYSGIKYGSISWKTIRAYGIWTPLAIKYTKNIMKAYEQINSAAIVINTSYSDAVIPWLKSSGMTYPDFGSGNINHLIPRIKFAVADKLGINDYWHIDVTFAVSHFHDVVISKEGHTEGSDMLIDIRYDGKKIDLDLKEVFSMCAICMPVDAKRNMMNASSNFAIIDALLTSIRYHRKIKLHCPGVFGEIGGYPVIIDGSDEKNVLAYICEDYFSLNDMRRKNRESIYLDGIENINAGTLIYTDELIAKVKDAFNVNLMKTVTFDEIENAADFLIDKIIKNNI